MTTISLQPGQPGHGMDYDPTDSLPYPIHVGDDDRCENVPGYFERRRDLTPSEREERYPKLVGFQEGPTPNPESIVPVDRWRTDPDVAVGLHPVFMEPRGADFGMFNLEVPITGVTVHG